MSGTRVKPCVCKHAGQDKLHGRQMRVFNWATKLYNGRGGWRCTVCGRETEA